ncbi:hypothetical protein H4R35_001991 [Dimargaris xerosporica]|nr:hypothetical protein H4R35_001991 [Dimargaris xerosporica]
MAALPTREPKPAELLRNATQLEERIGQIYDFCRESDWVAAVESIQAFTTPVSESQLQPCTAIPLVLEETNVLRQRLQGIFNTLLHDNIVTAVENSVDERLWKYVFYNHVELCRTHLRRAKASSTVAVTETRALWLHELRQTLDAAMEYYNALLASIAEHEKLVLAHSGTDLLLTNACQYETRQRVWIICLHRCLVYMGDVERYRAQHPPEAQGLRVPDVPRQRDTFQKAKHYYYQSIAAYRESGRPHAQLAILASYTGNALDVFYWYSLSLLLPYPSKNALMNLQSFIKSQMNQRLRLGDRLPPLAELESQGHVNVYLRFISLAIASHTRCLQESRDLLAVMAVLMGGGRGNDDQANLGEFASSQLYSQLGKMITILIGRIATMTHYVERAKGDTAQTNRFNGMLTELLLWGFSIASWAIEGLLKPANTQCVAALDQDHPSPHHNAVVPMEHYLRRLFPVALWVDYTDTNFAVIRRTLDHLRQDGAINSPLSQAIWVFNQLLMDLFKFAWDNVLLTAEEKHQVVQASTSHLTWLPHDQLMMGVSPLSQLHSHLPVTTDILGGTQANGQGKGSRSWQDLPFYPDALEKHPLAPASMRPRWVCWLSRLYQGIDTFGMPRDFRHMATGGAAVTCPQVTADEQLYQQIQNLELDLQRKRDDTVRPAAVSPTGNGRAPPPPGLARPSNGLATVPFPMHSPGIDANANSSGGPWQLKPVDSPVRAPKGIDASPTQPPSQPSHRLVVMPDLECWLHHLASLQQWLLAPPHTRRFAAVVIPSCIVDRLDYLKKGGSKTNVRAREVARFFADLTSDPRLTSLTNLADPDATLTDRLDQLFTDPKYCVYFLKPSQRLESWDQARPFFVSDLPGTRPPMAATQSRLNVPDSRPDNYHFTASHLAALGEAPVDFESLIMPEASTVHPDYQSVPLMYRPFLCTVLYVIDWFQRQAARHPPQKPSPPRPAVMVAGGGKGTAAAPNHGLDRRPSDGNGHSAPWPVDFCILVQDAELLGFTQFFNVETKLPPQLL